MEIETGDQYVIDTNLNIQQMVFQISSLARIEFEEPDHFSQAYPIYRSKFNDSWVWISPNRVPRAFIREGDERYEELKAQIEGTALRFPDISENSLFISIAYEPQRQQLLDILTGNGIRISALKNLLTIK